ncbi:MAG: Gfo/Idh/MocA family oxidoreductase [Candidatus Woesearchaeota archaeon]
MTKKIRLGIVGLGDISKIWIKAIAKVKDAELVAVCSRNESKVKRVAKELQVKGYTNYRHFLADSKIEAILILTPPFTHAEIGIKAAEAGKHVLVEKPIDLDLKKAEELIKVCQEKNVKLGVVSQMRFAKNALLLKKLIAEGKFGQLSLIRASMKWFRNQNYYEAHPWKKDSKKAGGGVLVNQAIHFVDLIRWLGGEYDDAFLFKDTLNYNLPVEDTIVGVIKFKNKATGVVEATTTACRNMPNMIEVHGTKGSVVLKNNRIVEYHFGEYSLLNTIKSMVISRWKSLKPVKQLHYTDQIEDFVQAIKKNRNCLIDGKEGLQTLNLCNHMYKNAQ